MHNSLAILIGARPQAQPLHPAAPGNFYNVFQDCGVDTSLREAGMRPHRKWSNEAHRQSLST